jgi:hypothetical protein
MTVLADLAPAIRLHYLAHLVSDDLDHGREQSLVQPLQVGGADNDLAADNPRIIGTALRHYAG